MELFNSVLKHLAPCTKHGQLPEVSPIDAHVLQRFSYNFEQHFFLLKELIESAHKELAPLENHFSRQKLLFVLHKIKGNAAILGASEVFDRARFIEEQLNNNVANQKETLLEPLHLSIRHLSEYLEVSHPYLHQISSTQ